MYRLIIALVCIILIAVLGWIASVFDQHYDVLIIPSDVNVDLIGGGFEAQSFPANVFKGLEGKGTEIWTIYIAAFLGLIITLCLMGGRIWQFLAALPARIAERNAANRKERGYVALTKGLAAVAAGDAKESAALANRSKNLLKDQKLTALLSAQSAQLQGREGIAKTEFKALLEDKETAFLGLRGLAMQALREGKEVEALRYVKEAQAIKPNAPWVIDLLYQLELRDGNALGSTQAIKTAQVNGLITRDSAARRLAPLFTHEAQAAMAKEDLAEALTLTGKALDAQSAYLPAVLVRAKALISTGKKAQAKSLISRAWKKSPHPDLLTLHLEASDTSNEKRMKKAGLSLLRGPKGRAGQLALGEFLLQQLDLVPAKAALEAAQDQGSARASRMLDEFAGIEAALAVEDQQDAQAVALAKEQAQHLVQVALAAPRDADWQCGSCGTIHADWQLNCQSCDSVGTVEWQEADQRRVVQPVRGLIERPTLSSVQ